MNFVLASGSPRRLELLQQIGLQPEIKVSSFTEIMSEAAPEAVVKINALGKGKEVAATCNWHDVIIAADTIVVKDQEILGKPKNEKAAQDMLLKFSGGQHQVLTGLAVYYQGQCRSAVTTTVVEFYPLSRALIESYVTTGEPLDKAGSYGIQGKGSVLVKAIKGSYSNVVGLPLGTLYEILLEMGVITDGEIFNQGLNPR